MNTIERLKTEAAEREERERRQRWLDATNETVTLMRVRWEPLADVCKGGAGTLREIRLLPTQEDLAWGHPVAIAFTKGRFDDFAQVLVTKHDGDKVAAWLTDELYVSRMVACAAARDMEDHLLEDALDVAAATGTSVSEAVVDMCLRKARAYGEDENVVAGSLVCAHYGMVAEENFNGGNAPAGKLLKAYGMWRILHDHETIESATKECCGIGADDIVRRATAAGLVR